MMKIKTLAASFLATCLFFVAGSLFATTAQAAPRLYFSPIAASPAAGSDIQVDVLIDVGASAAFGADATINIPSEISVTSVTNGGFFDTFYNAPVTGGKLELHGYLSAAFATKSGLGTFAHLTLRSDKVLGSSLITFACTAGGFDTEILSGNGDNILVCSSLNQFTLNYPASTPTPTPAPGAGDNNNISTNGPTNACGGTCGSNYNCDSGLYCYLGYCRNPDCVSASNCVCPSPTKAPVATKKATPKPLAKPTPQVVTLAKTTPYPSPTELAEATPAPESQTGSSSLIVWVVLGLIALIVIIIAVNSLKKKNPPHITPLTTDTYRVEPPMPSTPVTPSQNPPPQNTPPTGF